MNILLLFFVVYSVFCSSEWGYSRKFFIQNSEGTKTDVDVLITLDTKKMIEMNKLNSECSDILFKNRGISLFVFREEGCNTSQTNFWITIPNLMDGEEIEVFYGGSSQSPLFLPWSGSFIVMSEVDCIGIYSSFAAIDGFFLRGGTSEGLTGGSNTHSHSFSGISSFSGGDLIYENGSSNITIDHQHQFLGNSDTMNNFPEHVNLRFCQTKYPKIQKDGIMMVKDLSINNDGNWEHFESLNNKFPKSQQSGILSNEGVDIHQHESSVTISGMVAISQGNDTNSPENGFVSPLHTHGSNISFTTDNANIYPPYFRIGFSQYIGTENKEFNSNFSIIATTVPPKGYIKNTNYEGKFPRGASKQSEIGLVGGSETHNHTFNVTLEQSLPEEELVFSNFGEQNSSNAASFSHIHVISGTSTESNHIPPFYTMLFIEQKPQFEILEDVESWYCSDVLNIDIGIVCSNHGTCSSTDNCTCDEGFSGINCEIIRKCDGIAFNETGKVCNGKGLCTDENICECEDGYQEAQFCDVYRCFGVLFNDTDNVCHGHGICSSPNNCSCSDGYYEEDCGMWNCDSIPKNLTSSCGEGICTAPESCDCSSTQYFGEYCEEWECFSIHESDPSSCSGSNGTCIAPNLCNCSKGYEGAECESFRCFGDLFNTTEACSGYNGTCVSPDQCDCSIGYEGEQCELFRCFGDLFTDSFSCSGENGTCVAPNLCDCSIGYEGNQCEEFRCFGDLFNTTEACSGYNGTCVAPNLCDCSFGYEGKQCEMFRCYGDLYNESISCSGENGTCIAPDLCDCSIGYEGNQCEEFRCYGDLFNTTEACSGSNGTCISPNLCNCSSGYEGDQCETWRCNEHHKDDPFACFNGTCSSPGVCDCDIGYYGSKCVDYQCFQFNYDSAEVCNNQKGSCISLNTCQCSTNYYGIECMEGIFSGYFDRNGIIFINYEIPKNIVLNSSMSNRRIDQTSCSSILDIVELEKNGLSEITCIWKEDEHDTTKYSQLIVEFKASTLLKYSGLNISVVPISQKPNEKFQIFIQIQAFQGIDDIGITVIASGSLAFILGLIISIIILVFIIIIIYCIIIKKRIEKEKDEEMEQEIEIILNEATPNINKSSSILKTENGLKFKPAVFRINSHSMIFHNETKMDGIFQSTRIDGLCDPPLTINEETGEISTYKDLPEYEKLSSSIHYYDIDKSIIKNQTSFNELQSELEDYINDSFIHPNILRTYGIGLNVKVGRIYIFCDQIKMTFKKFILEKKNGKNEEHLNFDEKIRILIDLASALQFVHFDKDSYVGYLTGETILIDENKRNFIAKIYDSRFFELIQSNINNFEPLELITDSPSIIQGEEITKKDDIFAFGFIMFSLITESFDYFPKNFTNAQIKDKMTKDPNFRPQFSRKEINCPSWYIRIMKQCWKYNINERPNSKKLKDNISIHKDSMTIPDLKIWKKKKKMTSKEKEKQEKLEFNNQLKREFEKTEKEEEKKTEIKEIELEKTEEKEEEKRTKIFIRKTPEKKKDNLTTTPHSRSISNSEILKLRLAELEKKKKKLLIQKHELQASSSPKKDPNSNKTQIIIKKERIDNINDIRMSLKDDDFNNEPSSSSEDEE